MGQEKENERTAEKIRKHLPIGTGPYSVGCLDIMCKVVDEHGSFFRLYYPTEKVDVLRCHTIRIEDDHGTYYNLGCESKQTCALVNSIQVFGKRESILQTRANQKRMLCAACCDGALCNALLCVNTTDTIPNPTKGTPKTDSTTQESSTAPTTTTQAPTSSTTTTTTTKTTTDEPILPSTGNTASATTCKDKPECSYLLEHFSVCSDQDTAMNLCPDSCGYCTTTSMTTTPTTVTTTTPTTVMTTKPCLDQSETCSYLQNHLHICNDLSAVQKFGCFKTCKICGGAPVTVKTTDAASIPPLTTEQIHACSKGNSFHVMFISNQHTGYGDAKFLIASPDSGQAHVFSPYLKLNTTKNFFNFSEIDVAGSVQQNPQMVEKKGIHLYTSSEISLFVLNTDSYSTDGFLAMADECLGREYTASTYIDPGSTGKDISVFLSVMAMEDTTVRFEIRLTYQSDYVTFRNKQYRNGDVLVISLAQYETIELKSKYGLTGTRVTASKNIAFTTGSDCAIVGDGSCSHMETMYPPNKMLADKYIIPTLEGRSASILRVVSTTNETVKINATFSGQKLQKVIPSSGYLDFLVDAAMPVHFSCTDKVLVTLYVEGRSDFTGDPFSMFVPGYKQFLSEYIFITPDDGFNSHITVIIPKINLSGLLLDDLLFTSKNRTNSDINVEGVVYSVSSVSVTAGYHSMKHDSGKTFGVFVYGNGPSDGYGYPAGFSSL